MFLESVDLKAEERSLFLVSSGKNSIITFQHFVIQVVCENTRLVHLSLALDLHRDRHFSANHGSFQRARVLLGWSVLHFLVTDDVATN